MAYRRSNTKQEMPGCLVPSKVQESGANSSDWRPKKTAVAQTDAWLLLIGQHKRTNVKLRQSRNSPEHTSRLRIAQGAPELLNCRNLETPLGEKTGSGSPTTTIVGVCKGGSYFSLLKNKEILSTSKQGETLNARNRRILHFHTSDAPCT